MATGPASKAVDHGAPSRAKRMHIPMIDRMKAQLSAATLKSKLTTDELIVLEQHVAKLKILLSQ